MLNQPTSGFFDDLIDTRIFYINTSAVINCCFYHSTASSSTEPWLLQRWWLIKLVNLFKGDVNVFNAFDKSTSVDSTRFINKMSQHTF